MVALGQRTYIDARRVAVRACGSLGQIGLLMLGPQKRPQAVECAKTQRVPVPSSISVFPRGELGIRGLQFEAKESLGEPLTHRKGAGRQPQIETKTKPCDSASVADRPPFSAPHLAAASCMLRTGCCQRL